MGAFLLVVLAGATAQVFAQGEVKSTSVADHSGIFINTRPLKDLASEALQRIQTKQVVLDRDFSMAISGTIGIAKDGRTVILNNPKSSLATGDPEMVKLAQRAVLAFTDAGWLGYIDKLGCKTVTIRIAQKEQIVTGGISSEMPSDSTARNSASAMTMVIQIGALNSAGDDHTFLKAAKSRSEGKTFSVNFEFPKSAFIEIVLRKLIEEKEKGIQK